MSEVIYLPATEPTPNIELETGGPIRSQNISQLERARLDNTLTEASAAGNKKLVVQLCDEGADVNGGSEKNRTTPLIAASRNGHADVVEVLCRRKAEINAIDARSWTALGYAVRCGWSPVVEVLCQYGAIVNIMTSSNLTLLHYAAMEGDENMVKMLVRHGTYNKIKTKRSPRKLAEWFGYKRVARILKTGMPETRKNITCFSWPKLFDKPGNQTEEHLYISISEISRPPDFPAHEAINKSWYTDHSQSDANTTIYSETLDQSFPPESVKLTSIVTDEKKIPSQSQNDYVGEYSNKDENDSLPCWNDGSQGLATGETRAANHGADQAMAFGTATPRDNTDRGECDSYVIKPRTMNDIIIPYAWSCHPGQYIYLPRIYIIPTKFKERSRSMPDLQQHSVPEAEMWKSERPPPKPCRYPYQNSHAKNVSESEPQSSLTDVKQAFDGMQQSAPQQVDQPQPCAAQGCLNMQDLVMSLRQLQTEGVDSRNNRNPPVMNFIIGCTIDTHNNVKHAENVSFDGYINVVQRRGDSSETSHTSSSNYLTGSDRDINESNPALDRAKTN